MPSLPITAEELLLNESFQHWVKQSNEADVLYWENWIVAHPEQLPVIEEAKQMAHLLYGGQKKAISEEKMNAAIQSVTARIQNPARITQSRSKHVSFVPRSWQRMAAVWVGILLIGTAVYLGANQYMNPMVSYHTGQEETQILQLPDGSTVVLNTNSSVRFAKNWDEGKVREVWMEGEGYYDIKHFTTPSRKFVVHAKAVEVEVLGTTFNVWQRENQTKVILQTGKVQLISETLADTVRMTPGEMVEIEKDQPQIVRRQVDARLYTSWKDRQLFFDATPIGDVAALIEMQYGYKVRISDEDIRHEKFTYKPQSNNFKELLQVLQESFQVQVDEEKKTLHIDGN